MRRSGIDALPDMAAWQRAQRRDGAVRLRSPCARIDLAASALTHCEVCGGWISTLANVARCSRCALPAVETPPAPGGAHLRHEGGGRPWDPKPETSVFRFSRKAAKAILNFDFFRFGGGR